MIISSAIAAAVLYVAIHFVASRNNKVRITEADRALAYFALRYDLRIDGPDGEPIVCKSIRDVLDEAAESGGHQIAPGVCVVRREKAASRRSSRKDPS